MTSANKPSTTNKPSHEVQHRTGSYPNPWDDMDRFFENVFPRNMLRFGRWPWPEWTPRFEGKLPAIDIIDHPNNIVVRAEVPGIKKEDLDVSVSNNMVTIRATTKSEENKEEGEYYRREMRQGEFSRSINLPSEVDSSDARASFKDGILELTLPKTAPSTRRSIKIE